MNQLDSKGARLAFFAKSSRSLESLPTGRASGLGEFFGEAGSRRARSMPDRNGVLCRGSHPRPLFSPANLSGLVYNRGRVAGWTSAGGGEHEKGGVSSTAPEPFRICNATNWRG
jgi:hypothetical protein